MCLGLHILFHFQAAASLQTLLRVPKLAILQNWLWTDVTIHAGIGGAVYDHAGSMSFANCTFTANIGCTQFSRKKH